MASEWPGILEFKVPSGASSTIIDAVTTLEQLEGLQPCHILHTPGNNTTWDQALQSPSPPLRLPTPSNTETLPNQAEMSHHTTVAAHNIVSLKKASPWSCDTTRDMPSTYTIQTNPHIPAIQHAWRKGHIKYHDQIKKSLQEMVNLRGITPVTKPNGWISSLTYPRKPDGTLCICLDPWDLNKAVTWEHYKTPTLDEISY